MTAWKLIQNLVAHLQPNRQQWIREIHSENRNRMIFELCATILLIGLILKMTKRPHNFPPGPRGLPLVGYLPFFSSWDPQYPHKAMKKISEVYGPVVGLYVGPSRPVISVCSHEAMKEAMLNDDLNGRPDLAVMMARTFGEKLGERFQRHDSKFQELLRANELFFRTGKIFRGSMPVPAFLLKRFRFIREFIGVKAELIEPIQKFIKETIEDHQQRNPSDDEAGDFIDVYLKEMKKQKDENPSTNFTEKQLISTIIDLFGAGAESTSGSIGFAIIHLVRDQQVQQKMQMELDQVCGEFFPTINHRSSLPYTEAVLMEAQRCSTIAPLTPPHYAIKDTKLQGYTIPQGSLVSLNLHAVFQDSKYWKDPEVFRPERHLNDDGSKVIKSDHFYPFGLGKRMCLGESLAKNTYFLFTAALIKKFRFDPVPDEPLPSLDPTNGFTLGYQGFKAVVTPRS
ncbi:methyl farnesoate epoxidase isoform X4 [Daphnia magna]|uniref:methyl farnesoate epoxidase isoform X4 n=1 Tax=Daphnia magna TaxID=35525 RepID=UPI001E1BBA15|nr:methyl farnesoate epoxidase isoform X4 [Daphnia magna]